MTAKSATTIRTKAEATRTTAGSRLDIDGLSAMPQTEDHLINDIALMFFSAFNSWPERRDCAKAVIAKVREFDRAQVLSNLGHDDRDREEDQAGHEGRVRAPRFLNVLANIAFWFALYAIGIALWIDIIRSGFITPDLVGKIVSGAIN